MTRQECESKLLALAKQMRDVYTEYNPAGDFLSMTADQTGFISVNDCFFNADNQIIEDVHERIFKTVDVVQYSDGHIRYGNTVGQCAS